MTTLHLNSALKKARWKLLPLLIVMYALSILDRTNVGFIKTQLDIHLGIDAGAFALGVGIFFIGYSLFQIPSNLMLQHIGARKWLSILMALWGVVTFLMMYMTNAMSFYILRFFLGVIEAGFYPGIILFLSYWFPGNTRSQAIALVQLGAPIALILGAPLTGWILELPNIASLNDWQLVFGVQGGITVITAILSFIWLVDKPHQSKWLTDTEKMVLTDNLNLDNVKYQDDEQSKIAGFTILKNSSIWKLVIVYFSMQVNLYALLFYLPTQLADFTNTKIGLMIGILIAIPWTFSMILSPIVTKHIDRKQSWKLSACIISPLSIACILIALTTHNLTIFILLMSVSVTGFMIILPLIWNLVTLYLPSGHPRVIGTAFVGTIGTLGGFFSPILKTWAESYWQNNSAGIIILCLMGFIGVLVLITLKPMPNH